MRSRKVLLILTSALLSAAVVPAFAQTPPTPLPLPGAPGMEPGKTEMPIDIELSGPTNVRDYVDYLQNVTGLNIVLMTDRGVDATRLVVPPLKLKQMPAATAVNLLSDLPSARITVEQKDGAFFVIAHAPEVIVGPGGPVDEGGRPIERPITRVYSLEQNFFGDGAFAQAGLFGPDERQKELAEKTPQMLKLIEEALTVEGAEAAQRAIIKLHQGTNTLIVRGTPEQLATIQEVMKALAPVAPTGEAKAYEEKLQAVQMSADRERARLHAEIQALQEAVPRYQNELAALRANLDIAREKLRAAGVESKEVKENRANQPNSATQP